MYFFYDAHAMQSCGAYEVKNGKIMLNPDKIEDIGSVLVNGEKITTIDFEHALNEEVRLTQRKN